MVIPLRNKYGILFLIAVNIMVSGCQQQKEETPFYYGTWDEGRAPGPTDGVKSATVTFTEDEVVETEVMEGRGEVQLPFMAYKVISQSTDGSDSVPRPLLSAQKHAEKRRKRDIDMGAKWTEKNDDKNRIKDRQGGER